MGVPPLRREKCISRQLSHPSRVRAGKRTYVGSILEFSGHRKAVSVLHAGSNRALRHSGRAVLPLRPVLEEPVPVKGDGLRQAVLDVDDDRVTCGTGRTVSIV